MVVPAPTAPCYAYLLGVYLGDGYITVVSPRRSVLRVSCDSAYPGVMAEIAGAIERVHPGRKVWRVSRPSRCIVLSCSAPDWASWFPQHGPGRKHHRTIALDGWQRIITHRHAEPFVRGLVHTDGCRFLAHQVRRGRIYSYPRYSFSNRSEDIKRILCEHLEQLGIGWTRPNAQQIQIARRADVGRLDAFVGPKA